MSVDYSIGYYQNNPWNDDIRKVITDYQHITEVYFALPGQPSGRQPLGEGNRLADTEKTLLDDLVWMRERNIKLTLLLNAACYGDSLLSERYLDGLLKTVDCYVYDYGVTTITTTSPAIANWVKRHYGDKIETRASINMRVGNLDALEYLKEQFDGYYVRRELYRSFDYLTQIKAWAVKNGKKLYALVNSGCLAYCPWQSMHDNHIAHSVFAKQMPDGTAIPECTYYLKKNNDRVAVMKGTFIRPEDVEHYTSIFDGFKIATRSHLLPRIIVKAYTEQRFAGNLMDLMEPGHTGFFKPYFLMNNLFPTDWIEHVKNCERKCHQCDYCKRMAERVFQESHEEPDFMKYLI